MESRQDIIRLARLTRKRGDRSVRHSGNLRRWTGRRNCAIIAVWKLAAHNAEVK